MNREETAQLLTMITNHYWNTGSVRDRNVDLMIETWTMALGDIPMRPYIVNALERWVREEKWPPQASDLRERAKLLMKREREVGDADRVLAEYVHVPVDPNAPTFGERVSEFQRWRRELAAQQEQQAEADADRFRERSG